MKVVHVGRGTAGELSGRRRDGTQHARDRLDFFIEPPWCTEVLLAAEDFTTQGGVVYDPAAGSGTILRVCESRGLVASGGDIADRNVEGVTGGRDFLYFRYKEGLPKWALPPPPVIRHIICNPPYATAEQFCRRAIELAVGKVAMLVQNKFLFSAARWKLFNEPPLRVYFLSSRPSMPPGEAFLRGEIKATGGKMDFVWIIFAPYYEKVERTECRWLLRPGGKNGGITRP